LDRQHVSDSLVSFRFDNIPFNPYHLTVSAPGFELQSKDLDVRSAVPAGISFSLIVKGTATSVDVEAPAELLENDPTFHTDVDRGLFDKVPLESQSSAVSSL